MTGPTTESAEAEIRALLDARIRAIHAKDAEALAAPYDADAVIYNLAPPLQMRGIDRGVIDAWLGGYDGPIGCETASERIFVDGDVAFCHYLYHISGRLKQGTDVDMWVRATLGFRRRGGEWKIVHGHDSDPFDMQTFQALIDLKP